MTKNDGISLSMAHDLRSDGIRLGYLFLTEFDDGRTWGRNFEIFSVMVGS